MHALGKHLIPRSVAFVSLLAALAAPGCGGEEPLDDSNVQSRLAPPELQSIAPTELSVGDKVTILAEGLPERHEADVELHLDGIYETATGKEYHFEGKLPVDVENPSVATFDFYQLYFDPNEAETGTWKGTATLIVTPKGVFGDDVSSEETPTLQSNELDTTLRVGPSIVLERLKSIEGQGCADVTRATNANHELSIGFRAIGLGEASEANPWTFKIQYTAPGIDTQTNQEISGGLYVRYVKEDALGGFDGSILGDLLLDDTVSIDAPPGQNRLSIVQTSGDSFNINPKSQITAATISPSVEIGLNRYDEVVIGKIAAGPLMTEYGRDSANIVLEVETADGRALRRSVGFNIYNEVEVSPFASPAVLVQRYEPEQAYGCFPGGQNGRDLQYTEGESISKNRSLNFRWDQNVATNLGFMVGQFAPVIQATGSETWTESFGVDISEAVTSETHKSLNLTAHIIPTWFGAPYRQLEEVERTVDVIYHNACGGQGVVGQAVLVDYQFSFDVASGPQCPPETQLPPAESFRE